MAKVLPFIVFDVVVYIGDGTNDGDADRWYRFPLTGRGDWFGGALRDKVETEALRIVRSLFPRIKRSDRIKVVRCVPVCEFNGNDDPWKSASSGRQYVGKRVKSYIGKAVDLKVGRCSRGDDVQLDDGSGRWV